MPHHLRLDLRRAGDTWYRLEPIGLARRLVRQEGATRPVLPGAAVVAYPDTRTEWRERGVLWEIRKNEANPAISLSCSMTEFSGESPR